MTETFVFSVYALWQHVDLIPYMVTAPPVFEKISRGAGKSMLSVFALVHDLIQQNNVAMNSYHINPLVKSDMQ